METDPDQTTPGEAVTIGDFEFASRLSYFLWSTMPDQELLQLASDQQLHVREVLDEQIDRMLQSPKAIALVEQFASQWLNLGNLDEVVPDPDLFPEFTPELRADMVRETRLFVDTLLREDQSIFTLLDAVLPL